MNLECSKFGKVNREANCSVCAYHKKYAKKKDMIIFECNFIKEVFDESDMS